MSQNAKDRETGENSAGRTSRKARSSKNSQKNNTIDNPRWVKNLQEPSLLPESQEASDKERLKKAHGGKSPAEIFSLFCDDNLLNEIVQFSVQYANQNNKHGFKLTTADLTKFFGILILSGYHTLPQTDLYWSRTEDCGVQLVQFAMSRNRFREIKKYFHLCDNDSIDTNDKFAKVRLLIDAMNEKNIQFGIFSFNLSIDEEMIPYFGHHSAKMFIKGKFKK